jgi:NAD(P)H-nitrite reductase large subunit
MRKSNVVILGGGMVAGYAAKEMVQLGLSKGELSIFSADDAVPYERPPLSKGFLAGKDSEESIQINPQQFYSDHGIELTLRCPVAGIDSKRKRLTLAAGDEVEFQKLIIATGARPRKLQIPGSSLQNLLYLRTLDDSKKIRSASQGVRRAVVIGGGFIGMEVTAVLAQKGIEVTMILSDDRIWKRLFSPEMSKFFESYYEARGVRIRRSSVVTELRGDHKVETAVLRDGQQIECDLVVAGIGVEPALEVVSGSGLEIDNGIVVNEFLQTRHPDIYAAGDVANYQDVLFNKRRRAEHWDNAVSQGQHCARCIFQTPTAFRHVPYFFSDVFDLSYEYWGDSSTADKVVHRGDVTSRSFSVWWLNQGSVVAAFTMNRPDEERDHAPKWIESRQRISPEKLADESSSLGTASLGPE